MKKIKHFFDITSDTTIGGLYYLYLLLIVCVFGALFFSFIADGGIEITTFKTALILSLGLNLLFAIYVVSQLNEIYKQFTGERRECTYEDIKNNPKNIKKLSLEQANSLLLVCIENEEYELATLLKKHMKNFKWEGFNQLRK